MFCVGDRDICCPQWGWCCVTAGRCFAALLLLVVGGGVVSVQVGCVDVAMVTISCCLFILEVCNNTVCICRGCQLDSRGCLRGFILQLVAEYCSPRGVSLVSSARSGLIAGVPLLQARLFRVTAEVSLTVAVRGLGVAAIIVRVHV